VIFVPKAPDGRQRWLKEMTGPFISSPLTKCKSTPKAINKGYY